MRKGYQTTTPPFCLQCTEFYRGHWIRPKSLLGTEKTLHLFYVFAIDFRHSWWLEELPNGTVLKVSVKSNHIPIKILTTRKSLPWITYHLSARAIMTLHQELMSGAGEACIYIYCASAPSLHRGVSIRVSILSRRFMPPHVICMGRACTAHA